MQNRVTTDSTYTPVRTLSGILQRKCACGQHTIGGGECSACQDNHQSLQAANGNSELASRTSGGVPPIVHELLRSPGQPLAEVARAFMLSRFSHDSSRVRPTARGAGALRTANAGAGGNDPHAEVDSF